VYALHDGWPVVGRSRSAIAPLGDRESQVARLIAAGLTNRQIAARLTISVRTVDAQVRNIRTKLDLRTRAHIAAWVTRQTDDWAEGEPHS